MAETVTVIVIETVADIDTTGLSSGVSPAKVSDTELSSNISPITARSPPGGLLDKYVGNVYLACNNVPRSAPVIHWKCPKTKP